MNDQLISCACGNEKIAQSLNSKTFIYFCPECGRFVEAKSVKEASALWNSKSYQIDEDDYLLTATRVISNIR